MCWEREREWKWFPQKVKVVPLIRSRLHLQFPFQQSSSPSTSSSKRKMLEEGWRKKLHLSLISCFSISLSLSFIHSLAPNDDYFTAMILSEMERERKTDTLGIWDSKSRKEAEWMNEVKIKVKLRKRLSKLMKEMEVDGDGERKIRREGEKREHWVQKTYQVWCYCWNYFQSLTSGYHHCCSCVVPWWLGLLLVLWWLVIAVFRFGF